METVEFGRGLADGDGQGSVVVLGISRIVGEAAGDVHGDDVPSEFLVEDELLLPIPLLGGWSGKVQMPGIREIPPSPEDVVPRPKNFPAVWEEGSQAVVRAVV